jgi:phosphotransferase system HPr-like phosphotransfer protein
MGRFAERTEWEHCRDWDVEVTYSPRELERQAAAKKLAEQIAMLDARELGIVSVLCDDPDATKALAKLEAMRAAGFIKGAPEVVAVAVEETKSRKGGSK